MSITSKDLVEYLYYKKLPQVYRDADKTVDYQLKRYLESLIDGGFCGSIEDIEGILSLIDPKTIPEEFLPYLCESFGLEYFPDIDATYQRKFLTNIGEVIRRRGTFSGVHFLAKVLTGLDVELKCEDSILTITLLAKSLEELQNIETSMAVIRNYIQSQIPYFITPVTASRIAVQVINSKSYSHSAISYGSHYTISSKEVK